MGGGRGGEGCHRAPGRLWLRRPTTLSGKPIRRSRKWPPRTVYIKTASSQGRIERVRAAVAAAQHVAAATFFFRRRAVRPVLFGGRCWQGACGFAQQAAPIRRTAPGPDDRGAASDRFPPRRSKPAAAIEQPARRATDENQFQGSPAGEEPPCSATTLVRSRRRCFVRPRPPHLAAQHSAASNARRTHASMSVPLLLLTSSSALIVIESTLPSPPVDCAVEVAEEGPDSSIYSRT